MIALRSFFGSHGCEWDRSRQVDRESSRPGRETGSVETARAHRLNLGRVRLHGVIYERLTGALSQKVGERFEHVLVDGRMLNWGMGKGQGRRIPQLFRVSRHV